MNAVHCFWSTSLYSVAEFANSTPLNVCFSLLVIHLRDSSLSLFGLHPLTLLQRFHCLCFHDGEMQHVSRSMLKLLYPLDVRQVLYYKEPCTCHSHSAAGSLYKVISDVVLYVLNYIIAPIFLQHYCDLVQNGVRSVLLIS